MYLENQIIDLTMCTFTLCMNADVSTYVSSTNANAYSVNANVSGTNANTSSTNANVSSIVMKSSAEKFAISGTGWQSCQP